MIITLISLGLLVVGIILTIVIREKVDSYWTRNNLYFVSVPMIMIGSVATLFAVIFIIKNAINFDVDYQNMLHTKEMLEYRIEHMEENITGNEMLYNDIVEFNNELRAEKKWALNPWTNWFNNQDIASIDYIELDGD